MTTINNCFEFAYLFDVTNGNPNGDPDAANQPRQDYETGFGLVTDVCLKRKIRNYVEMVKRGEPGHAIYISEGAVLDDKHRAAYNSLGVDPKKGANGKAAELTAQMCKNHYDVRMMGALMVGELNCGKVRGPLQLGIARSIDQIVPVQLSITRMAATKAEEGKENKTMGNKWIVPYALYRVHGYVNAPLAQRSGATDADLDLLWEALREMWHYDKSAARPEMAARGLVALRHDGSMRTANTPELSDIVKVDRATDPSGPPRAWSDYRVTISRERLPANVEILDLMTQATANRERAGKRR
jgi:CRISPR-associated protein Csd2